VGLVTVLQVASGPGAVVRLYYRGPPSGLIVEQLVGIEVGHLKVGLKGVEEGEGCEVEGFHGSCVECPLIVGTEGATCG
jgi:hypothetical protein